MISTSNFEDLAVWQRSKVVAVEVCRASSNIKDWGGRDQIMRSSISFPSNIAEGAERNGTKEFVHFLGIAKGSLGELRTQIMIGLELNYFDEVVAAQWVLETRELSKMLSGLIKSLRDSST